MNGLGGLGYKMLYFATQRFSVVLLTLVLLIMAYLMSSGCAFNPAPVSKRPQPPSERVTYHVVSPGDTLFAIAWRYEKDVAALAQSNGLAPPYQIVPGQRLTLDTTSLKPVPRSQPASARAKSGSVKLTQNNNKSGSRKNTQLDKKHQATRKTSSSKTSASVGSQKLPKGEVSWRWPVKGAVSRQYDTSKVFKGINIQSLPGRAVTAAASGIVVYAGSGLRGYGKLIILKHSDIYLSAYAHNRALSIKEGDVVKAGEQISTVGGDPNNRGRLYFELRKNGKPVDPMRL
ncbi:MAG: peptidoglycan DD-metalloendopeptidase family protein, partial [Porticoccaceae bacterium]|nr:peptidoglycan DD-metalloendopeptidase family protein [Porticoccaceae bacterium]